MTRNDHTPHRIIRPDEMSPGIRRLLDRIPRLVLWLNVLAAVAIVTAVVLVLTLCEYPHSGGESILRHLLDSR